jgi:hypothetical protein
VSWIADAVTQFGAEAVWTYLVSVGLMAAMVVTLALVALGAAFESLRVRLIR